MRQYAGWQAPFYSFWSKSFYVDVAKNWGGLAYLYLLVLLCFTWLFMSVKLQIDFSYQIDHSIRPMIPQMPVITVDKGSLSIDKPSPYTVNGVDGKAKITFDTRDNPIKAADAPGIFLVKKNIIIFKESELDKQLAEVREGKNDSSAPIGRPDQEIDLFSTFDHAVMDQKVDNEFLDTIKKSIFVFVFPIALPCGFCLCVVQSLIYGLFAMAVASANQVSLSYASAVRLSIMAMTPVILLDSLLKLRNLDSIFWGPLALIITIGYIMFAVRSNVSDPNQQSQPTKS